MTVLGATDTARGYGESAIEAFDGAPLAMAIIDLTGRCLWVNRAAENLFGYSPGEPFVKTLAEATFVGDADDDIHLLHEAAAGRVAAWERVKRVGVRDGSVAWIHARYWVTCGAGGEPAHIVSQAARLTERQAAIHDAVRQIAAAARGGEPAAGHATDERLGSTATVLASPPGADDETVVSTRLAGLLPGWPPASAGHDAGELAVATASAGAEGFTVTLYEAARLMNVSGSTLRRCADSGRLACMRTSGGHRRFRLADIQRLRTERHQPSEVRMQAYPARPLPFVAATLERHGGEIATRAARCLYVGPPGWFEQPEAAGPIRSLLSSLARAFATGDFHEGQGAVREFMRQAELSGTSLAERHAFIHTLDAVLRRQLREQGCPRLEQAGAAQAAAAMAYQLIADHDRQALGR
jgi:PAS domain S-box-containing protein/excisionase family DNA binding protein